MDLLLDDQVAIVTGASRGIGRAIAQELAWAGMRLVLAARSEDDLAEVARSCDVDALPHPTDLREAEAPRALVSAAMSRFGRLDVLVNCAGATKRGDFLQLTDADWSDGYALKFFGAMRCCREAWPHLQESKGRIINIIGVGGKIANPEFTIGGSVNVALMYLTKALAARGVGDGIRVNAINPGSIATDRLKRRIAAYAADRDLQSTEAADRMAEALGVPRFGDPREIARVASFLASPASSYCWGSIVDVDGGHTRAL